MFVTQIRPERRRDEEEKEIEGGGREKESGGKKNRGGGEEGRKRGKLKRLRRKWSAVERVANPETDASRFNRLSPYYNSDSATTEI